MAELLEMYKTTPLHEVANHYKVSIHTILRAVHAHETNREVPRSHELTL